MSKALEALEDIRDTVNTNDYGFTDYDQRSTDECNLIEKELKAFEIIKKYPRCSLQRYIGFNELVKNGYELTQEHLFSHDIPCSVEEYNIVIEVLLNEVH